MAEWKQIVDLKKSAVIVVDMQNDFCHEQGSGALNGGDVTNHYAIVPNLQKLIDAAHNADVPVIFIKTTHDETTNSKVWLSRRKGRKHDTCTTGTWGAEYFGVAPTDKDIEVIKHRYSAFIKTDLELKLRALGCETLLMTGVGTNMCVESTLRDGFMLDFFAILVSDCTATGSETLYEATLENVRRGFGWVADSDEICSELKAFAEVV
ncbi:MULTISPECIES: cysteine hydrolase family protein [Paenibacillus]|uniref:cysteine hydrolase family protein n=1 Tax=Paenibacillus TaxID=44249 RepID=UPI001144846B|nr:MULTISPECIES: isochorismatase family cysteine hydrolase [unclassified Paenibacillus]